MKINFVKILLLGSQLAFTLANAENKCVDLFKQTSKGTPQTAEEILNHQMSLFKDWDSHLGKYADPDINVQLNPEITYLDSGYTAILNTIILGMPLKNQSVDMLERVQAHEYGHNIFNSHFTLKLQDQTYDMSKLVKKAQKEKKPGAAAAELEFFQEALKPYTEFFSDVVAVLLYRDSHAMAQIHPDISKLEAGLTKNILQGFKKQRPKGAPPPRSFVAFPYKLWKVPLYDQFRPTPLFDPYAVFDPVRGDLWNLYLKHLPNSEIPLFIDVILKTISDHVQAQAEKGEWPPSYSVPSAQTLDVMNSDFLLIFKKNAELLGLQIRKE